MGRTLQNGSEIRISIPDEDMAKPGFIDIALSVMTVSTVDGVKYHVIPRWRLSNFSSLNFTLF